MEAIADFVMGNLNLDFFSCQERSLEEVQFWSKCDFMADLDEAAFKIEIDDQTRHTFNAAIREVQKMADVLTPRDKLQQFGAAIKIIETSFSLYKGESSNADVLVGLLPYLLVKAKIDRLLAHFNFIEAFHLTTNEGDPVEVYRTNLKIAIQRIWDFNLEQHVDKNKNSSALEDSPPADRQHVDQNVYSALGI